MDSIEFKGGPSNPDSSEVQIDVSKGIVIGEYADLERHKAGEHDGRLFRVGDKE